MCSGMSTIGGEQISHVFRIWGLNKNWHISYWGRGWLNAASWVASSRERHHNLTTCMYYTYELVYPTVYKALRDAQLWEKERIWQKGKDRMRKGGRKGRVGTGGKWGEGRGGTRKVAMSWGWGGDMHYWICLINAQKSITTYVGMHQLNGFCLISHTSRYRLNMFGRRAFSVAGPTSWNSTRSSPWPNTEFWQF